MFGNSKKFVFALRAAVGFAI
jgi:hypothetical protein